MYRLITCGIALALSWLPGSRLAAQDLQEKNFVRYTTQQGLSHNTVTGIAQDSTGYLWVATASGLNRYNGNQFVQFHSSNDSNSLPAEALNGLVWLDRRRLPFMATVCIFLTPIPARQATCISLITISNTSTSSITRYR